jgi:hypothetical protein
MTAELLCCTNVQRNKGTREEENMAKAKTRKRGARKASARKTSGTKPKTWGIQIYRENWTGFTREQIADVLNQHVGGAFKHGGIQLQVWEERRWDKSGGAKEEKTVLAFDILVCPKFPCTG